MTKKVTTLLIAALFLATPFVGDALAGKGQQKGTKGKTATVQTNQGQNKGVCPFGNTPGTGKSKAAGQSKGFGPGDGTGNGLTPPKDGTGYGAVKQGKGSSDNPACDGTGPKGTTKRKGQDG